jgi:hypothetical protein
MMDFGVFGEQFFGTVFGISVAIACKVQDVDRLNHRLEHVYVRVTRLDLVPASLAGCPDVDITVLVCAVGEMSDVLDLYGGIARFGSCIREYYKNVNCQRASSGKCDDKAGFSTYKDEPLNDPASPKSLSR